jgi:hypothetical protein
VATPTNIKRRWRLSLILGTFIAALVAVAVTYASSTAVSVADVDAPTGSVTLAPGGSGNIGIQVSVSGAQDGDATFKVYRDWSLSGGVWTGSNPQTFNVPGPRTGPTPPLVLNTTGTVSVASGQAAGNFPLSVQVFDITNSNATGAKLSAGSAGSYSVTVSNPAPSDSEAPQNVSISIDSGADWTNDASGNVGLSLSATDNVGIVSYKLATSESGLASATANAVTPGETSFSRTVSPFALGGNEGASKEVWFRVCDAVGNCTADKDTIGWDKTAPSIDDLGPTTSPNTAGWYKTDVTNQFSASDGLSGLSNVCLTAFPAAGSTRVQSKTTAGEGSAVKVSSDSCTDVAGNTASAIESAAFSIDKTAPTVTCQSPEPAFVLNQAGAQVSAAVNDGLSGAAGSPAYGNADTSSVGPNKTVSITGYDNAENSTSKSCAYSVGYKFVGFDRPVDNGGVMNVAKAGQAIPLKWRLLDADDNPVTNLASAGMTVASLSCSLGTTVDQVEEYATGSSGLQNLGNGYYQLNWKSPSTYATSCKELRLNIGEGSPRTANFKFTK